MIVSTGQQLLRGLPVPKQLEVLGELYLDAREWRAEESQLLDTYRQELTNTRELVQQLYNALGEMLPETDKLPRLRPTKDAGEVKLRYRRGVKV